MKSLIEKLYPLHRTLNSIGSDVAMQIIKEALPNGKIEKYAGAAWTWDIPKRWELDEAYIEYKGEKLILDNPLNVVSYSLPIDKIVTWDELCSHVHVSEALPDSIPWVFKYYQRDWGFCLPKNVFKKMPHVSYHVVIRSRLIDEPMSMVSCKVGTHPKEIIIAAHTCHPMQANDDLSGVAVAVELANRLYIKPLVNYSVRFIFAPETIGMTAYLANNPKLTPFMQAGIFLEMLGNNNSLAFHNSRTGDALIDKVTRHLFSQGRFYEQRDFAAHPANDERILNAPYPNIPTISLNRWPYPEYHTSDDNMDIISEAMLEEAADVTEEILRIYDADFTPIPLYKGIVFLSKFDLFVDYKIDWSLNRAIEKIMLNMDGEHTIIQLADMTQIEFWKVYNYVMKFMERGLCRR